MTFKISSDPHVGVRPTAYAGQAYVRGLFQIVCYSDGNGQGGTRLSRVVIPPTVWAGVLNPGPSARGAL